MKKFNIISRWMLPVVAASVMVLAGSSCSESSSEEEGPALPSVAIKFDAQLYPLTRTDLNEKFRTSWKAGDAIGVFATTFGSELQSEGNVLNNAKLVYDGSRGRWITTRRHSGLPISRWISTPIIPTTKVSRIRSISPSAFSRSRVIPTVLRPAT